MSLVIRDAIVETLALVCKDHLRRSRGTIYPWLDAAFDFVENSHKLQSVYEMMEDDESRRTFVWFLKFRLAGYLTQSRDLAHEIFPQLISPAAWIGMTERANALPEKDLEGHLTVDVIENYILDGYNLSDICGVTSGNVVIDLGAFNGNSSIVFARAAGSHGKVYAFEPNPDTQEMLARNLKKADCTNVEIVAAGASDKVGTVRFSKGGAASHIAEGGDTVAQVTTVDEFVRERSLDQVHFIKFDIEGHELPAIEGAIDTIRRFRPKLAISIYHLHYDPHAIPLKIKEICPWYRFYVRHNNVGEGELVLFCTPVERIAAR